MFAFLDYFLSVSLSLSLCFAVADVEVRLERDCLWSLQHLGLQILLQRNVYIILVMSWQVEILCDIPTWEAQQDSPLYKRISVKSTTLCENSYRPTRREERKSLTDPDSKHVLRSSTQPLLEDFWLFLKSLNAKTSADRLQPMPAGVANPNIDVPRAVIHQAVWRAVEVHPLPSPT